jgi:hypothetical protein
VSLNLTADSGAGRLLLALRRGAHTAGLLDALGGGLTYNLPALLKAGLAVLDDGEYRITEAGRAACPFRNPLAATAAEPEKFTMPKGEAKMTRQQVLAAIQAAGAAGTTRKALIEKFGCSESNIDNHIMFLNRATPAVITKPRPGVVVAVEFAEASAPEPTKPVPAVDIDGVSLDVDHHEAADLASADLAKQMAQIAGIDTAQRYAVAFPSDFHGSIESAIAQATRDYESDSLKQAVIIACTPLGRIEVRPVFVPVAA